MWRMLKCERGKIPVGAGSFHRVNLVLVRLLRLAQRGRPSCFICTKKGKRKSQMCEASCAWLKTTQSVNFSHLKPSGRKLITRLLSCSAPSCTSVSELSYLCIHALFDNSLYTVQQWIVLGFLIVRLEVWWHGDVPDAVMTEWVHHLLQIPSSRLRSYAARIWDNVGLQHTQQLEQLFSVATP